LENNYYHFWVECLARYHLLEKSGIKPDYYILPDKMKFHKQFIQLIKIKPEQIIKLKEGSVICADNLVISSLINNNKMIKSVVVKQWLPSWLTEFYCNFQNPQAKPIHRIYISRSKGVRKILNEAPLIEQAKPIHRIYISRSKGVRKILNEAPLIEMLNKYNFKILHLEDLSVMEQIKFFNHASIIIAPHGAGLVNMSFSKKGTIILELLPQYLHESGLRILATTLGHNYNYLIGCAKEAIKQNLAQRKKEYLTGLDFSVDVNRIEKFLNDNI
jgi:capsular polysaccharide biosynthesis protein